MKATNLFDATRVLQRAKRDVLEDEHEIDEYVSDICSVQQSDIDVMLLEHDVPDKELFPNKDNRKYVEPKIKGDTPITEIEKHLEL